MTTDANRLTQNATAQMTSASTVRPFADALERLGYDVRGTLAALGLRPEYLEDPDASVPAVVLDRLICGALEERRHPDLGARVAAVTPIGAFPLLDYLVVTTDTVGGALDHLVRYFHLVCAPLTLSLVHDEDAVRLVVQPATNVFIAQYNSTLAVRHLGAETENRLRVSFVSLMREPDDRRALEQLLGCSVRAPSTWSGVEFPRDALRLPLRRRDSALHKVLEAHAAVIAAPAPGDASLVQRARIALASRVGGPPQTLQALARQLATTPRTLQRRLAAEGLSYQELVDVTRRDAAERLLADATLAVGEIGYLLGFSEPSAFHRAFKRWHDVTPQEYRSRAAAQTER